jgi:putative hydrolase of the HAD superfamily
MIKAIVFDVDNTLVDFIKWKNAAVDAAIFAMIDAGLDLTPKQAHKKIFEIYDRKGIEYQEVFDDFLQEVLGFIDYRILAAGIVSYRRARGTGRDGAPARPEPGPLSRGRFRSRKSA